ncbi:UDP-glucose flavonoid 3-O-glucosyltransferase 3 [Pyrus ussuriensis x Pyrus communis]|uniref:Glycosyltransferase n=1 Tax=Pyrus ussuriensis x Pyrus communis TaxID=2448454 RepID=A0A5N5G6F3_9ROSA|nr:UDP-glucose flavonoid 3-O-glucosyltransferase 3 [Pyrus ussuriensis x Pyrus communis]
MKKPAVLVFVPGLGIGHIRSTVEIAKQLVARDDQLFITILIMKLPFDKLFTNTDSSISHRINFVNLPETLVDIPLVFPSFVNPFIESHKIHVKEAVTKLLTDLSVQSESKNPRVLGGFVIDMFCTSMIDVANEFGVPSFLFYTSSAAMLGFWLHLASLRNEHDKDIYELINSSTELVIPSFINPVPTKLFPGELSDKEAVAIFLDFGTRFRETKGILVNTFSELEAHAIHSLSDGKTPPVYPVGPLLNQKSDDTRVAPDKAREKSDILDWLDDQPPLSVLFLCFGSMGSFCEAQVKEIARALEHSGLRFLWSLRQPPPKGTLTLPSDYADPKAVLPEGFLDRTATTGKVLGWAPQVAILSHPAVGGFVSHCGWNSALESIWHGVPIATWPMYAEQQSNAFELLELGLAVEIKMDYKTESEVVVSAEEIERGIKEVMELDSDTRKRVKETSEKGKKALEFGGSSYSSLGRFIDQI